MIPTIIKPLAGMDGVRYRKNELQLQPGDKIYLYTDGVTEATDAHEQLYGEDRLLEILNRHAASDVQTICEAVKSDVDLFVGEAPSLTISLWCALITIPRRRRMPDERTDFNRNG